MMKSDTKTPEDFEALSPIERLKLRYRDSFRQMAQFLQAEAVSGNPGMTMSLNIFDSLMMGFEASVTVYGHEMYHQGRLDGELRSELEFRDWYERRFGKKPERDDD